MTMEVIHVFSILYLDSRCSAGFSVGRGVGFWLSHIVTSPGLAEEASDEQTVANIFKLYN